MSLRAGTTVFDPSMFAKAGLQALHSNLVRSQPKWMCMAQCCNGCLQGDVCYFAHGRKEQHSLGEQGSNDSRSSQCSANDAGGDDTSPTTAVTQVFSEAPLEQSRPCQPEERVTYPLVLSVEACAPRQAAPFSSVQHQARDVSEMLTRDSRLQTLLHSNEAALRLEACQWSARSSDDSHPRDLIFAWRRTPSSASQNDHFDSSDDDASTCAETVDLCAERDVDGREEESGDEDGYESDSTVKL